MNDLFIIFTFYESNLINHKLANTSCLNKNWFIRNKLPFILAIKTSIKHIFIDSVRVF